MVEVKFAVINRVVTRRDPVIVRLTDAAKQSTELTYNWRINCRTFSER